MLRLALLCGSILAAAAALEPKEPKDVCPRNEVLPHLEFPYFGASIRVGESMLCRFRPVRKVKSEVTWDCMTPQLFNGTQESHPEAASLTLVKLQPPDVMYKFTNNWCSCTVRLHKPDGSTCQRKEVQFFQLLPPRDRSPAVMVSIGSRRVKWLKQKIVASKCTPIHICRDVRYTPDNEMTEEDTKMIVDNSSPALLRALRPHPRIVFKSSFRYPFAVLDTCKLRGEGRWQYKCEHRDPARGPGEEMYLSVVRRRAKPAVTETTEEDAKDQKPADAFIHVASVNLNIKRNKVKSDDGKSAVIAVHTRAKLPDVMPQVKLVHRFKRPKFSARRASHKQHDPREVQAKLDRIQLLSMRLKRRIKRLRRTMIGVEVAVVGCVILVLASILWYYAGVRVRRSREGRTARL